MFCAWPVVPPPSSSLRKRSPNVVVAAARFVSILSNLETMMMKRFSFSFVLPWTS